MKIKITKIVENKKRIIELLAVSIGFSIFLNQYFSQMADEKSINTIEYIGTQLAFTDSRVTGNEHLLRYFTGKFLLTNFTNFNGSSNPFPYNNTEIYCLKTDIFGLPPPCYNLTFFFEEKSNIERYFEETSTMNIERPYLYNKTSEFMDFILNQKKEIESQRFWSNIFFYVTLILFVIIVVFYFLPESEKNQNK